MQERRAVGEEVEELPDDSMAVDDDMDIPLPDVGAQDYVVEAD